MKSYLVTMLVELPESSYRDWSEHNDVYYSVLHEIVNDEGHLIKVEEIPNGSVDKYTIFDEAGGV